MPFAQLEIKYTLVLKRWTENQYLSEQSSSRNRVLLWLLCLCHLPALPPPPQLLLCCSPRMISLTGCLHSAGNRKASAFDFVFLPIQTIVGQCQPQIVYLDRELGSPSRFRILSFSPSSELTLSNSVTRCPSPSLALLLWLHHWDLQPDVLGLTQATVKARGFVLLMALCMLQPFPWLQSQCF